LFELSSLLIFAGANFIVLIIPGPAIIFTISRTLNQGRKAGLLSVYGLALGTLPHAIIVALGVASILASSAVAFTILRYLGAMYLVYIGIRRLLWSNGNGESVRNRKKEERLAFFDSFMVGMLNPKAILFFLAFLPQFIDPSRGNPTLQIMILWFLSQVMAVIVGSAYAYVASTFHNWLRHPGLASKIGDRIAGSIYVGLGMVAALSGIWDE
jgi:threonine/homoserine/homoserine lactone efflux protein